MKRILLFTFIAAICLAGKAGAQADLSATLLFPQNGTVYHTGDSIRFKTIIGNVGPDTLYPGDSILLRYTINGNTIPFYVGGRTVSEFVEMIPMLMWPGDTIHYTSPPANGLNAGMAGGHNICAEVVFLMNPDINPANNTSCHNINVVDTSNPPSSRPALHFITPDRGGNAGSMVMAIYGAGFDSQTHLKLTRPGSPDILVPSNRITILQGGRVMNAAMSLYNRDTGVWSLEVTIPGDTVMTLSNCFTVASVHITQMMPASGGNAGVVTGYIYGNGFAQNTRVKLTRSGYPDIIVPDSMTSVSGHGGRVLKAGFDLSGRDTGLYNVVVYVPGGGETTLANGFRIEPVRKSCPEVSVTGVQAVRTGMYTSYYIRVTNPGNVDAENIMVTYASTHDTLRIRGVSQIPVAADSFDGVPLTGGKAGILLLDRVPAGGAVAITAEAITHGTPAMPVMFKAGVSCPLDFSDTATDACLHDLLNTLPGASGPASPGCIGGYLAQSVQADSLQLLDYVQVLANAANHCLGLSPAPGLYREITEKITGLSHALYEGQPCDGIITHRAVAEVSTTVLWSYDPNDKTGPAGAGRSNYIPGHKRSFSYLINFENDTSAAAAAQVVRIVDTLDKDVFDLSTFRLGPVKAGDSLILFPEALQAHTVYADFSVGAENYVLKVEAGLDANTGIATWIFTTLDPETMQLITDPYGGFLPPNHTSPEGQGSVFFDIELKEGLPDNTVINNTAYIYFDVNPPIITNTYGNKTDIVKPDSRVHTLPRYTADTTIPVAWSGTDNGSGIRHYSVYVSVNNGSYELWIKDTAGREALFAGTRDSTYRFYSVATDSVGNRQDVPLEYNAITTLSVQEPFLVKTGIKIFPNPATQSCIIEGRNIREPEVTVQVRNTLGQLMLSELVSCQNGYMHYRLDVSGLSSGLYTLEIRTEEWRFMEKITKQ